MITINTKYYTTEQLKCLIAGLCVAKEKILDSIERDFNPFCTPECKAYTICTDIKTTLKFLRKEIQKREALNNTEEKRKELK